MSRERELLKEIMCYFAKGDITIRKFENSSDVAETLHTAQELLAQPKRESLGLEIMDACGSEDYREGFKDGALYAEKCHGIIGGGE